MFNLLIGLKDNIAYGSRFLEYTDDSTKERLEKKCGSDKQVTMLYLTKFPVIMMPEIQDSSSEQVAQIGSISNIKSHGGDFKYDFTPDNRIQNIPTSVIRELAYELGVEDSRWEFNRTHWAVKDIDLYKILWDHISTQQQDKDSSLSTQPPGGRYLNFPVTRSIDSELISIMMPFTKEFEGTYEAVQEVAKELGLKCVRADEIWQNHRIMDDICELLWTSSIIISDLSGKNANVFYETRLAHMLNKDTIMITQSMNDIPFDLKAFRAIQYYPNNEGLQSLKKELKRRIRTLLNKET
jgi:hypothetical protein